MTERTALLFAIVLSLGVIIGLVAELGQVKREKAQCAFAVGMADEENALADFVAELYENDDGSDAARDSRVRQLANAAQIYREVTKSFEEAAADCLARPLKEEVVGQITDL